MPSLIQEFKDQHSIYGKVSVSIYGFIIIFGGMTTLFGIVAPIASADCMAAPFSDGTTQQADQLVWFKGMGRMCGALGTLFLVTVYLLGHSVTSCFLLFVWGWLNFMNFAIMIPADCSQAGGSDSARDCMKNVGFQVGLFAALEAVAVLCAWLEERSKPALAGNVPLSSSE